MQRKWVIPLLIFLLFVGGNDIFTQAFHPYFQQFSQKDGLPSSEVYFVLQDQEDFMWFATDNGVARFDGQTFEVFGHEAGLDDGVVFKIREDLSGVIWVSTYTGRIFYFDSGCFHPYRFNDILEELKKKYSLVTLVDVNFAEGFLFKVDGKGLFYIDGKTNIVWLNQGDEANLYLYEGRQEVNGKTSINRAQAIFQSQSSEQNGEGVKHNILSYEHENKGWKEIDKIQYSAIPSSGIYNKEKNEILLCGWGGVWNFRVGGFKERLRRKPGMTPYIFRHNRKGYLLCHNDGGGVQYVQSQEGKNTLVAKTILEGHSVVYGMYDRQGGLWLCSRDAGVFYAPYPDVPHYAHEQGLSKFKVLSIALAGDSIFYAGYSDGSIYQYNYKEGKSIELTSENIKQRSETYSLYYDEKHKVLYANEFHFKINERQGNPIENRLGNLDFRGQSSRRIREFHVISKTNNDHLPISLNDGVLGYYDLKERRIKKLYEPNESQGEKPSFRSYHIDQEGRHWVGTLHNLLQFYPEQGIFVEKDLGQAALNNRVEDIRSHPSGMLLFGTRGGGLVCHTKDTTYTINEQQGLVSNYIRDIHIRADSSVWIATLSGLCKIRFTEKATIDELRCFDFYHGLSSEEIYKIDSKGDTLWLVTGNGITPFFEPEFELFSPPPKIRAFSVNGLAMLINEPPPLKAEQNNVEIKFSISNINSTINYRVRGKINYRYRHQLDVPWQYSKQTVVNYFNLNPDDYRFEVQAQNQDGVWSESVMLGFSILTPWYKRWPAITMGIFLLTGLITFGFYQRDLNRRKDQAFTLQIDQLERAALHAQMNPHFVFNSLSSIQNYIIRNDKESAISYLAKFARLIRSTLSVSREGVHSLADEIDILNIYCTLEKLRFQEGFDYAIQVADHLNPDVINLPPLLIQPFVENAIKHGLKDREIGGKVDIIFEGNPEEVCVRILDNGIGFDPEAASKGDSMGMDITRRRLELMERKIKRGPRMKIQLRYDLDGQITGTEIIIFIRTISK